MILQNNYRTTTNPIIPQVISHAKFKVPYLAQQFYNTSESLSSKNDLSAYEADIYLTEEILKFYKELNLQEYEIVQRIVRGDNASLNLYIKNMEKIIGQKKEVLKRWMGNGNIERGQDTVDNDGDNEENIKTENTATGIPLIIEDEPCGNVIANKYIEPPIRVRVSDEYLSLAQEKCLQVTATLYSTLSETVIEMTSDGKQLILQGFTALAINDDGNTVFNKLKIMEVTSKYNYRPFCINLQLQKVKEGTVENIGEPIRTSPLVVQSRLYKSNPKENIIKPIIKKRSSHNRDSKYIDITPLLTLPQKQAALKLGISESMLCKRFKENTRRKWPYRHIQKLDKMIRVLSSQKIEDDTQDKLQRLQIERDECLQPVSIRITSRDNLDSSETFIKTSDETPSPSHEDFDEEDPDESDLQDSDLVQEDAEISFVVQTLQSFKHNEAQPLMT